MRARIILALLLALTLAACAANMRPTMMLSLRIYLPFGSVPATRDPGPMPHEFPRTDRAPPNFHKPLPDIYGPSIG